MCSFGGWKYIFIAKVITVSIHFSIFHSVSFFNNSVLYCTPVYLLVEIRFWINESGLFLPCLTTDCIAGISWVGPHFISPIFLLLPLTF